MVTNRIETIVYDVAPLMAKERQKRTHNCRKATGPQQLSAQNTLTLTKTIFCWKEHLEAALKFFFFFFWYPALTHPEGCDHLWVWAQHIFLCLPGDHWIWLHWSVSVPFEELPNGCHAKQHNQPRHSVCVKYIGYAPAALPSQQNEFTVLKSCSYFHVSHNSSPVSLSAALFCSIFIPCLVCIRSACVSSGLSSLFTRAS